MTAVNDALGQDSFGQCFSTKHLWQSESFRLVSGDCNISNATNIDIIAFRVCLPTQLRLTHITFFNKSLWTFHWTLFASVASNFLFRCIKVEKRNSSSKDPLSVCLGQTDLLKKNDTLFWHSFLSIHFRRLWLSHDGYIILFIKFRIIRF